MLCEAKNCAVLVSAWVVVHHDLIGTQAACISTQLAIVACHFNETLLFLSFHSASSTSSCIWCKCSSDDSYDAEKHWSITNLALGALTIEENALVSGLPKSKNKCDVSHHPIFPSTPLQNIVINNLHLYNDVLLRE